MAELTDPRAAEAQPSCCSAEAQNDCCEPTDKAECCEPEASTCGCSAGAAEETAQLFGAGLYGEGASELPDSATMASLGCGNPTAIADLCEAEVVLDPASAIVHARKPS